mgnify:CR=1 FL=1
MKITRNSIQKAIENNDIGNFKTLCPEGYCATGPAKAGNLEMVKHVLEDKKGFFNKYSLEWAEKNGYKHVLEYLKSMPEAMK